MENKSRRQRIIGTAISLVVVGVLWAIIWPVFKRAEENARPSSCQSNLKQISLAMFQYTADYDEKYAQANVNDAASSEDRPFGWADALQPYLKSTQIFQCPSEATSPNPNPIETGYTDYWYNTALPGVNSSKVQHKASIFFYGEGSDGTDNTNARYSLSSLPLKWRTDKSSPSHRHLNGGNYAFLDGHTKWLKHEEVSTEKPNGENATFAIR